MEPVPPVPTTPLRVGPSSTDVSSGVMSETIAASQDQLNVVPSALPVEREGPNTPVQQNAITEADQSDLLDLLGRLHLQEPRAM